MGCLLVLLAALLWAPPADAAEFGIDSFAARLLDAGGQPEARAGARPDRFQVDFQLSVEGTGTTVRDLAVDLPPGFAGAADAVPPCPKEGYENGEECPPESQVGILEIGLTEGKESGKLPLFQLESGPGELPSFVSVPSFKLPFVMRLRPDDLGITFESNELPELSMTGGHVELWGIPADHQAGTAIPRRALLTAPTRCGPLTFTLRTRSEEPEAPWLRAGAEAEAPLGGCEGLIFEPRLAMELTNPIADSPTGARVELTLTEESDPDVLATAQLKDASIALPEGTTVSPGGAAGMTACRDAQLGLGQATDAQCPPASRAGAIEFESGLLPEPLTGAVYLGEERPGERFRLFMVAGREGTVVKFVAVLRTDPATGRLSVVLAGLPQIPLRRLTLNMEEGPSGLLASPLNCGTHSAVGAFVSHSEGPQVESLAPLAVLDGVSGGVCSGGPPFAPSLAVTSSSPLGGRETGIAFSLRRKSGEQLPSRFSVALPPGLSTSTGMVEICAPADAAAGTCPAASRVGEVQGEVGSRSSTATIRGGLFLAGPYRGAPFSLAMALRAALGPFDLGTIGVRSSLRLDQATGRVSVLTDRIPAVFEGIPLRFRRLDLSLSRPGFIRNPTSCAASSFDTRVEAQGGALLTGASPFPVHGCGRLGFKPRIRIALRGRRQLRQGGQPGMRISTRLRRGDANLRALKFAFPEALKFRQSSVKEICAREDAREGDCPPQARVGTVEGTTPLLAPRLQGSVYVVQPRGTGLPDLWIGLAGQGLQLSLPGRTVQRDGRLVTKFVGLADIPFTGFTMRFPAGEDGLFSLDRPLCAHGRLRRLTASSAVEAQNGKRRKLRLPIAVHRKCRRDGS